MDEVDKHLKDLLQAADARFTGMAPSTPCLRDAVFERRRRRRKSRLRVASAAAGLAVLIVAWRVGWLGSESPDAPAAPALAAAEPVPEPRLSPGEIEQIRHRIAELDRQAEFAARIARELAQAERLASLKEELARELAASGGAAGDAGSADLLISDQEWLAERLETAARIGVQQGDTLRQSFGNLPDAEMRYRSVVEHFPDSRWGGVARQRLEALAGMN